MAENPLRASIARIFLAIPLHETFQHEIERILRPLCREIPGVRWTEPSQVHLTLHFFGSVPTKEIALIDHFSNKIATLFYPLKLRLGCIGGFPCLERPNILWLGVEDLSGKLLSLQKAIQGEVRTLGFKVEARSFSPHATLGRVKRKSQDFRSLLAKLPLELPISEKVVDHFILYQSHCRPEGVHYEILKKYPFSKKA